MSQRESTTALAEGALMAALAAGVALMGIFLPPLQLFTNLVWTLPITVLTVRRNLRTGIMATLVAGLLVGLLGGLLRAFFLFIQFAGIGLLYGYLFKQEAAPGRMVMAGTLVALVSLLLSLGLSFYLLGWSPGQLAADLEHMPEHVLEIYRRSGVLEQLSREGVTAEELRRYLENLVTYLRRLVPAMLATVALFTAFINYVVAEMVLRRLKLTAYQLPPFRHWQLPWYSLWGVIAGLGLSLLGDYQQMAWLKTVGLNILYLYLPLLLGNGLAVVSFFAYRFKWPWLLKAALIVVFLINIPLGLVVVLGLGLFDPFLGWRKPREAGGP
ncbi:YybS family protein [Moorellaceae bacterium AZ2]